MEQCARLFREITGFALSQRCADYRSSEEIDETLSEVVSRLFLEKRRDFYFLKESFEQAVKQNPDGLLFSALGYFFYVDCDFKQAIRCFQKAIALNPADLGQWFSLAFCYRQTGQEREFNAIMLYYDRIIDEFIKKKSTIDALILRYVSPGKPASRSGPAR